MPSRKSPATTSPKNKSGNQASREDAYSLLNKDHQNVQKLFREFEKLHDGDAEPEKMQALANRICMELRIHTQIEEEIFYPALREALEDADLLDEAQVEHNSAKDLIDQIEQMAPDAEMYAACVKVLGEYVNHHIEEEQNEIFPAAKKAKVDADELGESMASRKQELQEEQGADDTVAPEWEDDEESQSAGRRGSTRDNRSSGRTLHGKK